MRVWVQETEIGSSGVGNTDPIDPTARPFYKDLIEFITACCCSVAQLCETLCDARLASLLCFDFLATRHVGSQLPDQESNPHPLHGKAKA